MSGTVRVTPVLRVGLTGGIASGKSAVSRRLAERGAVVIDADLLAREVVERGTDGLAEIVEAFGPDVLAADGSLDRPAMGKRVFGDADARKRLEAIIHPRVRARAAEIEAAADDRAIVVHDIPLLVETGQADRFDVVLVVDAPTEVQVERLVTQRGMSEDEARARIASQASRDERLAAADLVVDNSGSPADLDARVDAVWADLIRRTDGGAP
jgi:dephospho-CoA kinase